MASPRYGVEISEENGRWYVKYLPTNTAVEKRHYSTRGEAQDRADELEAGDVLQAEQERTMRAIRENDHS